MAESPISFVPLSGGISNQKFALVGLILTGIIEKRPVVIPDLCQFNPAIKENDVVSIWSIFDRTRLEAAIEEVGVVIQSRPASSCDLRDSWQLFSSSINDFADKKGKGNSLKSCVGLKILGNIVPENNLAKKVNIVTKSLENLEILHSCQLRIEIDWVSYCSKTLFQRHRWGEDIYIGFYGILKKISNTFGRTINSLYVSCDISNCLERQEYIREIALQRFGYRIYFKEDFIDANTLLEAGPLERSIIDFEAVVSTPNFVGLSRSTFSNTCALTKLARNQDSAWKHYIFNGLTSGVSQRFDDGVFASAAEAIAGERAFMSDIPEQTETVSMLLDKDVKSPRDRNDLTSLVQFFEWHVKNPIKDWSAAFVDSEDRRAVVDSVLDLFDYPVKKSVERTDYLSILRALHKTHSPQRYFEIGVNIGASLELAAKCELALGVDPAPSIANPDLKSPPFFIKKMTSDEFFRNLFMDPQSGTFDFAFIDGLHIFEFALRDFIGAEAAASTSGVICIHDVLPNSIVEASRVRLSRSWTGDVWRVVLALQKFRPDLLIEIVDAAPTGLAIVKNLDPQNRRLIENYDDVVAYGRSVSTARGGFIR